MQEIVAFKEINLHLSMKYLLWQNIRKVLLEKPV